MDEAVEEMVEEMVEGAVEADGADGTDVVVEQVESSDRWMVIRRRAKMLE